MNKWLDQLNAWQFAFVYASCLLLAFVIAGIIVRLAAGHVNLSYLVGYGVVATVAITSAATWARQRRHRRASRSMPPTL
jgi:hypothetical protein